MGTVIVDRVKRATRGPQHSDLTPSHTYKPKLTDGKLVNAAQILAFLHDLNQSLISLWAQSREDFLYLSR